MKNLSFLIALIVLFNINTYAQEKETRNLASFSGIKAAEGIDVYLKKGNKPEARVEATGTSVNNVLTEVSGGYLKIHMREGNYRSKSIKVYVTYVNLDKLIASSGANIFTEDVIKSGSIVISSSSGADVEAKVDCDELTLEASSGGDIVVEGRAKKLTASASSAGDIDAYRVEAEVGVAKASSGAGVKLNVTEAITANASSGGSIRYRGSPSKTNTNSSSGGSVKKSN